MPKGANNWISERVKPWAAEYRRKTGHWPRSKDVVDAIPELKGKESAIQQCIQRHKANLEAQIVAETRVEAATPIPAAAGPDYISQRLSNVRTLLETIERKAAEGFVDATAYEKLARLERDLVRWSKERVEEDKAAESTPTWAALLDAYKVRTAAGVNRERGRSEIEHGTGRAEGVDSRIGPGARAAG